MKVDIKALLATLGLIASFGVHTALANPVPHKPSVVQRVAVGDAAFHWKSKASRDRYLRWYYATHKPKSKPVAVHSSTNPTPMAGSRYTTLETQSEYTGKVYSHTVLDTSGAYVTHSLSKDFSSRAQYGVTLRDPSTLTKTFDTSGTSWTSMAQQSVGWTSK